MCRSVPHRAVVLTVLLIAAVWTTLGRADTIETPWYGTNATGQATVRLYFFWTDTCPHCRRARPFVDGLAEEFLWLEVRSLPLTEFFDLLHPIASENEWSRPTAVAGKIGALVKGDHEAGS